MIKKQIYSTIFTHIMICVNNVNRITAINITNHGGEKYLKPDHDEAILMRLWDMVDDMGGRLKCFKDKQDMFTIIKMTVEKDVVFEKAANRYGVAAADIKVYSPKTKGGGNMFKITNNNKVRAMGDGFICSLYRRKFKASRLCYHGQHGNV